MRKILNKKILVTAALSLAVLVLAGSAFLALNIRPTYSGGAAYSTDNPDVPGTKIHYVDDWATFEAAWTNSTCSKIVLLNDIAHSTATEAAGSAGYNEVTRSEANIEIDGRNPGNGTVNRLHIGNRVLCTNGSSTAAAGVYTLHVHDIELRQNISTTNSPLESYEFIFKAGTGTYNTSQVGNWIFRFGNITINRRNISNVNKGGAHHLAHTYGSAVEFYGYNVLEVSEEVLHCSSVEIEDGTTLLARKMSTSDTSMFYYYIGFNATTGSIARNRGSGFRIGDDCLVVSYNDQGGTTFPTVYYSYSWIEVGENSTFAATMTGNAFRAQRSGTTHFTVGANSVINLTSLNNGQPAFEVTSAVDGFLFESQPGAEIVLVGNNNSTTAGSRGVINMDGGTSSNPNQFVINQPRHFDIRNKAQGNYYAIYQSSANNRVAINGSDIDVWYTQTYANTAGVTFAPHSSSPNLYTMDVSNYEVRNRTSVTTSDSGLSPMQTDRYTRISGGANRLPEVIFEADGDSLLNNPQDADKFIRVRAILSWTPHDDGVDQEGNVEMIPVYAPPSQVRVWLSSDDGDVESSDYSSVSGAVQYLDPEDGLNKWFLPIDANGYLVLPPGYPGTKLAEFLQPHSLISAKALRSNAALTKHRLGEEFTAVVKDVTPPAPAEISGKILSGQSVITGRNGEYGATVSVAINNGPELDGVTATVAADGSWTLTLPGSVNLTLGDSVSIFMKDAYGNKNPVTDTNYHDAVFPAASVFTVEELPAILHIRQIVQAGEADRYVPEAGYATVQKRNGGVALETVNTIINSGVSETDTPYTFFTYPPMATTVDSLLLNIIDPQYYTYTGYKLSSTEADNGSQTLTAGTPAIPVSAQTELWVTLHLEPRTNTTTNYGRDAIDNDLGTIRLPMAPAMSLSADAVIGPNIANDYTYRISSQNTEQIIKITSDAWGDGISSDAMNWTRVSGSAWGAASVNNATEYTIAIPGGNVNGTIKVRAVSVSNPSLRMEFTIKVVDLIVMNTDKNIEMTQGYIIRTTSSLSAATVLDFTASKSVDWRITLQTGARASLSSANGTANTLTIPANYRGVIYIKAGIRTFRVLVTRP
jgi:hypothetical protein